jgi:G:T/U-mismatch repair DNA glycosylase
VVAVTGSLKSKVLASLLAATLVGAWMTPGVAHDNNRISHNWSRHYKRLAKRIFYTKGQSNTRFINVGEQASNAALLDGLDSTAFASASHVHAGADITSGTVDDARIDALLARDAEVFGIVTSNDGAGSTLDADLLDGLSSGAFAGASHVHSGDDITSGTVAEARIAAALARDSEVVDIVLAADGTGSTLDADLLDGQSSAAFAGASHVHSGDDITTGTVDESVIDVLIARVSDVFDIVLAADGSGSGLDADLLDGQSSAAFAGASHVHSGADITTGTVTEARIDALLARDAEVFGIVTSNDGAGSTLDADLLDGLSSSAFETAGLANGVQWFKEAADSSALAGTSERVVFTAPEGVTITDVFVEPAAALTASDTAYATIIVSRRDADGGGKVTVASRTTQATGGTGSWTAFSSVSLGSLSNTSLTEGQKLTIEVTKTGLGVALPVLIVQIEYTVD